jgi:hypothetical protein
MNYTTVGVERNKMKNGDHMALFNNFAMLQSPHGGEVYFEK